MAIVHSSNGQFRIDGSTGWVIEWNPNLDCDSATAGDYGDIVRFDLDEYFRHYTNEDRAEVNQFDILDLGNWDKAGRYEPAEKDFRDEIRSQGPGTILR